MTVPTPGQPNNAGILGYVADTAVLNSVKRGFFDTLPSNW